jgi:sugar transferase EpsL
LFSEDLVQVYDHFGKRLMDLVMALFLLMLFFPLLCIVAAMVRLKMGTPIIFQQERPGLYGRGFFLLKFRSMDNKRGPDGNLLPDELRITPLGGFLRNTSMDELPELINVLRGEMSLVGPRPLLMKYLGLYSLQQTRRHEVKPGITGWAQIGGRNAISWDDSLDMDVWYVEHLPFWLDLKILVLTLWKVLNREGITEPGLATRSEFRGKHD